MLRALDNTTAWWRSQIPNQSVLLSSPNLSVCYSTQPRQTYPGRSWTVRARIPERAWVRVEWFFVVAAFTYWQFLWLSRILVLTTYWRPTAKQTNVTDKDVLERLVFTAWITYACTWTWINECDCAHTQLDMNKRVWVCMYAGHVSTWSFNVICGCYVSHWLFNNTVTKFNGWICGRISSGQNTNTVWQIKDCTVLNDHIWQ